MGPVTSSCYNTTTGAPLPAVDPRSMAGAAKQLAGRLVGWLTVVAGASRRCLGQASPICGTPAGSSVVLLISEYQCSLPPTPPALPADMARFMNRPTSITSECCFSTRVGSGQDATTLQLCISPRNWVPTYWGQQVGAHTSASGYSSSRWSADH